MPHQLHVGLRRRSSCLAEVAGEAAAHHVAPLVGAPAAAREDVVQGEVSPLATAVLTGIPVTVEDLEPRQLLLQTGALHMLCQADY